MTMNVAAKMKKSDRLAELKAFLIYGVTTRLVDSDGYIPKPV